MWRCNRIKHNINSKYSRTEAAIIKDAIELEYRQNSINLAAGRQKNFHLLRDSFQAEIGINVSDIKGHRSSLH